MLSKREKFMYKNKKQRKDESIVKLKSYGIDYIENLPSIYDSNDVEIKSVEEIAKRYIANIISIQFAYDILNENDI